MTFDNEDYEQICVAMALLDAANEALWNLGWGDEADDLQALRNRLNDTRLGILKPHGPKTYHVSNIKEPA